MIKALIFDLDGTLTDSIVGIMDSINEGLLASGLDKISREEAIYYIGDGIHELITRSIAHSRDEALTKLVKKSDYEAVLKIYLEKYQEYRITKTSEFPRMTEVLTTLKQKGYKLFVLSNKLDSDVKPMIDYFFKGLFDDALGESPLIGTKPDVKGIYYILNKYDLKKGEVLYVGDSHVDMQTCNNAQIKSVVCSYGYERIFDLDKFNPTYKIEKPIDLLEILE